MPMYLVMRIIYCLLLIVCGALAASGIVLRKRPDAAGVLGQLIPIQGILGTVLGLWSLVLAIRLLEMLTTFFVFSVLTACIATVVGVFLGFVLAYGLLDAYFLSKNAKATGGGASMNARIVAIQSPLGLAGIVFGIVYLILILV